MLPNIATPTMNDTIADTENVGMRNNRTGTTVSVARRSIAMKHNITNTDNVGTRNNRTGTTGSVARRSTAMKSATSTTATAARPMIIPDAHGYSTPPHVVMRTIRVTLTMSKPAPAQSMTG